MSVERTAADLLSKLSESVAVASHLDDLAVACACWLSNDVLLLTTTTVEHATGQVEAFAECGNKIVRLAVTGLSYSRPHGVDTSSPTALAVMLRLPTGHIASDSLTLLLRLAGRSLRVEAPELKQATVSLDALLRVELAALGPSNRADVLAFLAAGPGEVINPEGAARRPSAACCSRTAAQQPLLNQRQLSKSLHAAREALRERLPMSVISVAAPQGLQVDTVLAIDDRNFYVQGWMRDDEAPTTHLTAVTPEGCRMEIFSRLYRYRRPDVEEFYGDAPEWHVGMAHGWIVHLETSAPSLLARGWTFEMGNAFGSEVEVSVPEVTRDPTTMRELILRDLHRERLPADRLRAEHIAPALTRLEERRRSLVRVDSIDQHGNPAADPDISIVVPLYGRIDFVEQQLAQFVHDPEFQNADLLYILDSPDLADAFRVTTAQLAQLYNVPFRAVVMSHNVGFSGVNNVGGDLARGRLLLLLNSDVFPREPGWLSALTAFYDQTSGIGALGPKLLYEDDSIQHAGLYFRRLMDIGIWNNEHYYKGLHRNLPAANVARAVPAVTAACMVIDLELYREMGGLRGMYIQGDYEDSDLCLRLSATGYQNWYLPDVELYHLEGQSYRSETRQLSSAYNRWLHSHIWNDRIASIMRVMR